MSKHDPFEKSDPLGKEIAIRAGIERSGLSLKAKIRALTALDRLIGAAFDIPGIWFERRAERARLIAATEQEAMKIDTKAFIKHRQDAVDSDYIESAWLKESRHYIENKAEVISFAIDELEQISSTAIDTDEIDELKLDDWLNAFAQRAEMASSEEMRSIFGRILAGEIVRPGSFSVQHCGSLLNLIKLSRSNFKLFAWPVLSKEGIL